MLLRKSCDYYIFNFLGLYEKQGITISVNLSRKIYISFFCINVFRHLITKALLKQSVVNA